MLNFLFTNIRDLDMSAGETLRTIYFFGGTALACTILIVILNMAHKIDQLKKEIKNLQDK
jgi:hypothetical protein